MDVRTDNALHYMKSISALSYVKSISDLKFADKFLAYLVCG